MAKGDHLIRIISITGGLANHHGIDCGDGTVIHYTGEIFNASQAAIERTSYEEFQRGEDVTILRYPMQIGKLKRDGASLAPVVLGPRAGIVGGFTVEEQTPFVVAYSPDEIVKRAESRLGEANYNLFGNNCEHFATWCITGESRCAQWEMKFGTRFMPLPNARPASEGFEAVPVDGKTAAEYRDEATTPVEPPQFHAQQYPITVAVNRPLLGPTGHPWLSDFEEFIGELDEQNRRHGDALFPQQELAVLHDAMSRFELTIPLIGDFSSGKSSLLNAWLGQELSLATGLAATTAVPAELRAGKQTNVVSIDRRGIAKEVSTSEFAADTPGDVIAYRLSLAGSPLDHHPHLVPVDMPGLDSTVGEHQEALDAYLPTVGAVLLVVDGDRTIRKSVLDVVRELLLRRLPLAVLVTKGDLKTEAQNEEIRASIAALLESELGIGLPVRTTSAADGRTEALDSVFKELANQAPQRAADVFLPSLIRLAQRAYRTLDLFSSVESLSADDLRDAKRHMRTQEHEAMQRVEGMATQLREEIEGDLVQCELELGSYLKSLAPSWAKVKDAEKLQKNIETAYRYEILRLIETRLRPRLEELLGDGREIAESAASQEVGLTMVEKGGRIVGRISTLLRVGALLRFIPNPVIALGAFLVSATLGKIIQKVSEQQRSHQILNEIIPRLIADGTQAIREAAETAVGEIEDTAKADLLGPNSSFHDQLALLAEEKERRSIDWESTLRALEGAKGQLQGIVQRLHELKIAG